MHYRRLGRTGLRVSAFCVGTSNFGYQTEKAEAFAILGAAAEAGVNFVDTADMYPGGTDTVGVTEEIVGEWLAQRPRDTIVLASKCWGETGSGPNDRGLSRAHILNAVEASLRRLGTDYIDLYHAHFPDPNTPIDETLQAFDDLIRWGKVRYVGASNFHAWELAAALRASDRLGSAQFVCNQQRYSVLYREIEDEVLPLCRHEGLGVTVYNPLAGGLLSGKYQSTDDLREGTRFTLGNVAAGYQERYWDDEHFREVRRLKDYFAEQGVALAHAAIAWTLAQDGITSAIVGASRREQIEDSLKAGAVELSQADLAFCDDAWYHLPRRRAPGLVMPWKREGGE